METTKAPGPPNSNPDKLDALSSEDLCVRFGQLILGQWCDRDDAKRWTERDQCTFPYGPYSTPITTEEHADISLLDPAKWLCSDHNQH